MPWHRQLAPGSTPLVLPKDFYLEEKNCKLFLTNTASLKQGRGINSSVEEYAVLRKTERQETAGNVGKPKSLMKTSTIQREKTNRPNYLYLSPSRGPTGNETVVSLAGGGVGNTNLMYCLFVVIES